MKQEEGGCCGLNEMSLHSLGHLNTRILIGGAVWICLGCVACWRKYDTHCHLPVTLPACVRKDMSSQFALPDPTLFHHDGDGLFSPLEL